MKGMFSGDIEAAVLALRDCLGARAVGYEIFASETRGRTVECSDRKIDAFRVRSDRGVGIRVLSGGRPAFGFSNVLDRGSIESLASRTIEASLEADEDEGCCIPAPAKDIDRTVPCGAFDPAVEDRDEDRLINTALVIEEAALGFDPRIRKVRKASYSETMALTRVVNSNGVDAVDRASFFSGSVTAIASADEQSETGWEVSMGRMRPDVDPRAIGASAAKMAVDMLGARGLGTIKCAVLIANTAAIELLDAFSPAFMGDNVLKGKSMLKGREGKRVAAAGVNIIDDGRLERGWASSAHDAEGVETRRTVLVKGGVLEGFLYDASWARKAGTESTGNARRGDYRGPSHVGASNFYMEAGEKGFDALLKGVRKGVLITEFMGAHTINTVTGEFSVGAKGFWVEDGDIRYPVRGIACAGNLLDMFSKVEMVGNDLRFIGGTGSPSLLAGELDLSGAG